MAWECAKCGHKSGKRTTSSYGCNHEWWDENELADAREKKLEELKKQQEDAETQRELFVFNYELWNTEEGLKFLKGENGWDWICLVENDDEGLEFIKGEINWERFKLYLSKHRKDNAAMPLRWRDSNFGTDWFLSEYGQQYLKQIQDYIIQTYSNLKKFDFGFYDKSIYFGLDWSQTEQGKQYIDNLCKVLRQRELSAFNELCYTEEGLKSLKGEKELEWLWLVDKDGNLFSENDMKFDYETCLSKLANNHRTAVRWRDSTFGTDWFSSKYGQQYLDEMQSIIVRAGSNTYNFELKDTEAYTYFGKDWLQTEKGKQYMDGLREALKKAENKKFIGHIGSSLILFGILPFAYFSFMIYLFVHKEKGIGWFIMFCLAAIAWFASIIKKEFWFTILMPVLLFLSALFMGKVILPRF